jgi:hypothetical protein
MRTARAQAGALPVRRIAGFLAALLFAFPAALPMASAATWEVTLFEGGRLEGRSESSLTAVRRSSRRAAAISSAVISSSRRISVAVAGGATCFVGSIR